MLIQTAEGVINTDHIVSATEAPGNPGQTLVRSVEGERATVGIPLTMLERACGVIVPAQPGFTVISAILPSRDEEGIIYSEEPVIAFRIGHNGEHDGPMPITISGEPSTIAGGLWTTRQPNGVCFGPEHVHDDADAFKADCEAEDTRRNAPAA